MDIKNQDFQIVGDVNFEFFIDAEFEIEIALDQPCFANCVLVASGHIDADEGLYPYCSKYSLKTTLGNEKEVSLATKLEIKIDSKIDDLFQKAFDAYCEKEREEISISKYEGYFYA